MYLATSEDIQGLVAQGRTIAETIEIARDVARMLLEEQGKVGGKIKLQTPGDQLDYPIVFGV